MSLHFNLSKNDYHKGILNDQDKETLTMLIKNLFTRYDDLEGKWLNIFNKFSMFKNDMIYYKKTLRKTLWATVHYVMISHDKLTEDRFYELLRDEITTVFPIVLGNDKKIIVDNPFLYEPPNAFLMHIATFLPVYYANILKEQLEYKNRVYFLNLQQLFKSISACLTLFGTGDDVHGMAMLRGFIQQFTRLICLNDDNVSLYMKYVKLNYMMQVWQNKRDKEPMPEALKEFLEENDLTVSKCENYLLYGWHVVNGKPVTSMNKFIDTNFNRKDANKISYFYHLTSEFVHEDYLFTSYNYPNLRKKAQYFILEYANMTLKKLKDKVPLINKCMADCSKEIAKIREEMFDRY